MYLRTIERTRKDGSTVQYYQLAHNTRDPVTKNARAEVIHSFGRADELDREGLVRLCRSIARVCNIEVRDPVDEAGPKGRTSGDVDLPDDFQLLQTVELGPVVLAETLWEKTGIGDALRAAARADHCKVPYERALLAMTANRLCEPESKLGVWDRWLEKVYLPSCRGLKLDHMYEAMDLLHRHSAEVEEAVFFKTADLMNLEVDLVFYDTTTTSFAIDYEDDDEDGVEGLRKRGHSKEGTWTPQVVVALAVSREGVPVRSWVFPGNTTDVTTVETVKADLKGWKLGRALFVADSGMNSEENRRELGKACGKYLLATRVSNVAEIRDEVLSRAGRFRHIADNLHAKEVVVGDGEARRRYILCYNPEQAERERKHRERVVEELEQELASHRDTSATAQWAIELQASRRYQRYLAVVGGSLRIDREAIKTAARYDGRWVLQTNDDTLGVEDAASGYKSLLVIERCFRTLKRTQIKMGPMYHWLQRRIEAHVKICVLALLLERVAELKCQQPWPRLRRSLGRLQATEFQTAQHRFFRRTEPSAEVSSIFKTLDIEVPKRVFGVVTGAGTP